MPRKAQILQTPQPVQYVLPQEMQQQQSQPKPKKVLTERQLEILRLGREKRMQMLTAKRLQSGGAQQLPEPNHTVVPPVKPPGRVTKKPMKCNNCNRKMVTSHDKKIVF